jgi:hypothetical protein
VEGDGGDHGEHDDDDKRCELGSGEEFLQKYSPKKGKQAPNNPISSLTKYRNALVRSPPPKNNHWRLFSWSNTHLNTGKSSSPVLRSLGNRSSQGLGSNFLGQKSRSSRHDVFVSVCLEVSKIVTVSDGDGADESGLD